MSLAEDSCLLRFRAAGFILLFLNVFFNTYFQRPRVCILGGGFGGLYTALRLDSLVWPNDKRPQVK